MIPRLQISFPFRFQREYCFGTPYKAEANEFLLDHARSGILLALKATGLPAGAGVGVMIYNCHTVANSVAQAGYKPVFLDVTDELKLDLEDLKRKSEDLSAIVVTHLFGIVNDVTTVRQVCPGRVIIEDCAHAYGKDPMSGDFAVFSIGQGKHPSIGDGGILRVLNDRYGEAVKRAYEALPSYSAAQSLRLYCKLVAKAFLYNPLVYGCFTLPLKRKCGVSPARETLHPRKMCRGIRNIYRVERNRVKPRESFMRVLYCQDPVIEKNDYRKKGIDTDTHFANSINWAKGFGYQSGECPNAEILVKHLLMVPTYFEQ